MSDPINVDALLKARVSSTTKTMCYKLVDTFAGMKERKLWLKAAMDHQPKTNGYVIEIPFEHGRAYQYTEHELSHILFDSDPAARAMFVADYAQKIAQVAKAGGVENLNERALRRALDFIVNVLDDERVISLWGVLYAGSEAIMRRMKHGDAKLLIDQAHEGLLPLIFVMAGGHGAGSGKLDRYRLYIAEALRKVQHRDYFATLVIARWLITQLVSEIIRESRGLPPPPLQGPGDSWEPPKVEAGIPERSTALNAMLSKLGRVHRSVRNRVDDVTESKFKQQGRNTRSTLMAQAATTSDVNDKEKLEQTLSRSARRMDTVMTSVRNAARNALTEDDRVRREAFAKVVFHDVGNAGLVTISPDDQDTVRRLRATFLKIMGRRTNTLEDTGIEIDVPSLIQRRLTGEPIPVFRADKRGRGFRVIVLIDRSLSMRGARTKAAERACRVVNRALKFPFVDSDVWGFQSWKPGEVNITRFQPGSEVFNSGESQVGGATPIHIAIRVALRQLEDGSERKHLFVISDGWPVFQACDGSVWDTESLMSFVRTDVMTARSKGIGVTGVLIGRDMSPKGMNYMFGHSNYWRLVSTESLGNDLVKLITGAFIEYLRGG